MNENDLKCENDPKNKDNLKNTKDPKYEDDLKEGGNPKSYSPSLFGCSHPCANSKDKACCSQGATADFPLYLLTSSI